MKQFIIDDSFRSLFPEAVLYVSVAEGIRNTYESDGEAAAQTARLNEAARQAAELLTADNFADNDVVREWREAYRKFKTKSGARSSVEALLKRAKQGREFTAINPLVDMYNYISIKYQCPAGGEDVDKIAGALHIGLAKGGEHFVPLGGEENEPALAGEVIYYDDEGAVCRCFNWREAQRTMLTAGTQNAILVIEAVNAVQAARAKEAMQELETLVTSFLPAARITRLQPPN